MEPSTGRGDIEENEIETDGSSNNNGGGNVVGDDVFRVPVGGTAEMRCVLTGIHLLFSPIPDNFVNNILKIVLQDLSKVSTWIGFEVMVALFLPTRTFVTECSTSAMYKRMLLEFIRASVLVLRATQFSALIAALKLLVRFTSLAFLSLVVTDYWALSKLCLPMIRRSLRSFQ